MELTVRQGDIVDPITLLQLTMPPFSIGVGTGVKALGVSLAINGVVTTPILILLMVMSRDCSIVGRFRISTPYTVAGRLTTAFMTLALPVCWPVWSTNRARIEVISICRRLR
jgi:hypothetical protein